MAKKKSLPQEHEGTPHLNPATLVQARALFDTSGTAGKADHDYRRAYPIWDKIIDEETDHSVKRYAEGGESLEKVFERQYRS